MNRTSTPRVIVVQPVVPSYRKAFFSAISERLGSKFSVYSSNFDMGVLTGRPPEESWWRALGPMKKLFPGAAWQAGALGIKYSRGDIVVVSGDPRCLSNMVLLLHARLGGAKTIWWGQLWSATSRMHRFLLRLMLMRLAHAVLFYTDAEVATYKARFRWRDQRPLGALNNGIFVREIQTLREPYDPAKRGSSILFIGRLTGKAKIKLLLHAMTLPQLTFATLHVIGDGPDGVALQAWARSQGLGARVIWHGGTVDESVIAPIANRSAVFCYPGGVGLSLVHAMAYGLPAVVHDHRSTHMPEIAAFQEQVTGQSFSKGCVESLSNTLAVILDDIAARVEMSAAARLRADNIYNTDAMADRFVSFVEKVAKTH